MKRGAWLWMLLVPSLLMMMMMMMLAGTAVAADDVVPKSPLNLNPATLPLYERYPLWAYSNDANMTDGSVRQLQHVTNAANLTKAWSLKLGLRSVEYAATWRMPIALLDQAEQQLGVLRELLWQGDMSALVTAAIVLSGGVALWLAGVAGRSRAAWTLLLRTLVILVLATVAFETAGAGLRAVAVADGQLNTMLFAAVNQAAAPADARRDADRTTSWALTAAGDAAWRTMVVYPWAVQEFGSLESAARYSQDGVPGGLLLEKSPAQRMEWYWRQPQTSRERDLAWWNEDALPRRITVAAGSAVGALAFTGGLLVVAGGVLVSQAVLLFLCALAPLAFVLALWPGFGSMALQRWGRSTLRAALGQVVSVALLAVMTGIVQVAGSLEEALGWEAVLFLLAGLSVGQALVWRAVVLRWVRRPAVVQMQTVGGELPGVSRPGRTRVVQTGAAPAGGRAAAAASAEPASAPAAAAGSADAGTEVADALAQQMATSRTRMLMDTEGGRFVQRPHGIAVAGSMGPPHTSTRVSTETVRITESTRLGGEGPAAAGTASAGEGNQAASVNTVVRDQSGIRRPATISLMPRRPS